MKPMIFIYVKLLITMSIPNSCLEFEIPFKLVVILDAVLIFNMFENNAMFKKPKYWVQIDKEHGIA